MDISALLDGLSRRFSQDFLASHGYVLLDESIIKRLKAFKQKPIENGTTEKVL